MVKADTDSVTAKLREQADRIDLWAALQSEHGFSPISIDMRSEVDRIDGYIRELKDEINWLNAELHGAEMEAKKLRELVLGLKYCAHEAYGMCARVLVGGERPFTCCPLYDFDAKKYRCEKLMLELGIEVK